jgi:hypothetical protein
MTMNRLLDPPRDFAEHNTLPPFYAAVKNALIARQKPQKRRPGTNQRQSALPPQAPHAGLRLRSRNGK